jgi:hypothetical protein
MLDPERWVKRAAHVPVSNRGIRRNCLRRSCVFAGLAACGELADSTEQPEQSGNPLLASERTPATMRADVSALGIDCRPLEQYTAHLGALTVDCLGTIAANSYAVDRQGIACRTCASALPATTPTSCATSPSFT